MIENEISAIVLDAAIEVHRQLGGPGLLEDMYEEALCHELTSRGLSVRRQVGFKVRYKGKGTKKASGDRRHHQRQGDPGS